MNPVNFTDHIRYENATNATAKLGNASEEFFNWSGHRVVVVDGKKTGSSENSFNLPLVVLKFLASLTVVIPLAFLILRSYTRSVLLNTANASDSASLHGRVLQGNVSSLRSSSDATLLTSADKGKARQAFNEMQAQISTYYVTNKFIDGDQYDEGNKILDSLEKKFCSDTPKSKGDLLNELRTAEKELKKCITYKGRTVDGFNPDFHELKDALRAPPASA